MVFPDWTLQWTRQMYISLQEREDLPSETHISTALLNMPPGRTDRIELYSVT